MLSLMHFKYTYKLSNSLILHNFLHLQFFFISLKLKTIGNRILQIIQLGMYVIIFETYMLLSLLTQQNNKGTGCLRKI